MAESTVTIDGGGVPAALQELLMKQELQFNLLMQENERNTEALRGEIGMIKQRLIYLESLSLSNPAPVPTSPYSNAEMGQACDTESLTRDNIDNITSKYDTDPNADNYNNCEIETCELEGKSKYELLNEEFIALKIDYQVLKYQVDNPDRTMQGNSGQLAKLGLEKCELEQQVVELRRELQLSTDNIQTLHTRDEQMDLKEERLRNSENQIANLETTYAALLEQYNETHRNNGALERQITELREELTEARGTADASPQDKILERSRLEVTRLQSALKQREEQTQRNEQAFTALQQENQRFLRDLLRVEKEKEEILKRSEDKAELLQSLLDDKQYFSGKLESQERTIAELRPLAEVGDKTQRRCHKLEIDVSELELNYQIKCSEYNLVIEQRNKLYNHCEVQSKELSELRMYAHTYENAIKERDEKLRIAKDKAQECQTQIDTHSVSHQFLQEELNRRERECQDKQAEIQKARADLENKEREIGELRRTLESRKNLENSMLHNPYMIPYSSQGASQYMPPASSGYYNSPES